MSSSKVERAVSLISQIKETRDTLAELESEFERLVTPKHAVVRTRTVPQNGKASPSRNKIKILRIISKSTEPISPKDIGEKIKLTHACISFHIRGLLDKKNIVRTSRGHYTKA